MSGRTPKQKPLTSFFQSGADDTKRPASKKRRGSQFGNCPICEQSIPFHRLELHASGCTGLAAAAAAAIKPSLPLQTLGRGFETQNGGDAETKPVAFGGTDCKQPLDFEPTSEPIPGLFLYEDFITEDEERSILSQLDGTDPTFANEFINWKPSSFNGRHFGKRWGVHCNLRDRCVGAAENPLPNFVTEIFIPKLRQMRVMKGCVPNEANAIDYYRAQGHYLVAHVDDRKLSNEPIANMSLAGDCYMTFTNVSPARNTAVAAQRVLLKRRCLQILTGKARYDFSHGIAHADLLSDRRVSITMRESPLTKSLVQVGDPKLRLPVLPKPTAPTSGRMIQPSLEPLPGLFVFRDFISEAEEMMILKELDSPESLAKWSTERHTGLHREKRWGIDHDLWSRELRPPKHALPDFMRAILIPRLRQLLCMKNCVPNEVNAIEYRRLLGHSITAHVDDRQKHKEPIANLSLAGDCYMTYRNVKTSNCHAKPGEKVLLQRRTLQVLTGSARYDYSHGISNTDLLSDRRVSITMREATLAGTRR